MDVSEISMMYIVYLLAYIGQIKDDEGNRSKEITRNMLTNLVSQEDVSYGGESNIAPNKRFDPTDGKVTRLFTLRLKVSIVRDI